jgi:S-adenosylmethionine:tRNA ribosyltransferase-isomerase
MSHTDAPGSPPAKLLAVDADGHMRHLPRTALAALFEPGDLVVANDAATLPASLKGTHQPTGKPIELRLAAWVSLHDPTRFDAIAFGAGDYRTRTEDRPPAPPLASGDRIDLGPLTAVVGATPHHHPRLFRVRFLGSRAAVLAGLARHGRPIQYAHRPEPFALWDAWTRIAADPIALEPPSAGFALDWSVIARWRRRGVGFATLTHAAGISSTGDPALDAQLPLDEPYRIPAHTTAEVNAVKSRHGRVIAVGTTVVRALEAAATPMGRVAAGDGVATGRIGPQTRLRTVDAILSGVHEPEDSHFQLLRAFASDEVLSEMSRALRENHYRGHEAGDSVLIERRTEMSPTHESAIRSQGDLALI